MDDIKRLSHSVYDCKYHVVFIPKCRKKVIYGKLRHELGPVFRDLATRMESEVEEGHLMPDHVHMLISIPPKFPVAGVIGFMKGKCSIWIARNYEGRVNVRGARFWARGYYVSTVGHNEELVRKYIREQEHEDMRLDNLELDLR